MKELVLEVPQDRRPAYLRIADAIRVAIQSGQARRGEALPSTRHLARTLGAHRHTVMSALNELISEGWIVSRERETYRVCETLPSRFFEVRRSRETHESYPKHSWRMVRQSGQGLPLPPAPGKMKYSFQSGLADLRLFPHDEFRSCLSDSLKRTPVQVMSYGDPAGHETFISVLKDYLRRVRAVSDREIIVTHGSQEAIFLTAQALIRPGDSVAVERLGYRPAWEALRATGARLVPVETDSEGIQPESLSRVLKRRKIRLIYLTPLHQYPTTVTLPMSRRFQIYELAARHGVPILEDDYDHEFHYRSQPLAPMASRDPAEQIIYVSTFSKVLFPSARLGFMAVPKPLAPALKGLHRIITRQNDSLLQDALARWMKEGGFERHLRRMRRTYEERRNTIVQCLEAGRESHPALSFRVPDGGMAIWVDIGSDSDALARKAAAMRIHVTPESAYSLISTLGTHLRLGFANQTPDEIRRGMNALFSLLRS